MYDLWLAHEKPQRGVKGDALMNLASFGKRLKMLRIDREMSQTKLRDEMEKCCEVSIGETYISELERTTKMPSLEVAAAMAKVLDVSLDYLGLLVDEAVSYRPQTVASYITPEADELATLVDKLALEQRQALVSTARSMVAPTQRQRERTEIRAALDSIEERHGRSVRLEVEQIMRNKGIFIDPTA